MSERTWARKQYLASADFRELAEIAEEVLSDVPHCLIGGLAVAYHANPPVTVDIDYLVDADTATLDGRLPAGWSSAPLRFPARQKGYPRRGRNFMRLGLSGGVIDCIEAGDDEYLLSVIGRALPVRVQPGLVINILTPEDLVVIKTVAGREKDVDDVAAIEHKLKDTLDWTYINAKIDELL